MGSFALGFIVACVVLSAAAWWFLRGINNVWPFPW